MHVQGYTGLNNIPAAEFSLYPIPVRELLMIESNVPVARMDLSSFESGIYLVRLWDKDGILLGTRKILKE